MFVRCGRNLKLPETADNLEGPTNRETARAEIERAFGIGDLDDPNVKAISQKGRATVRDITPYLFLSGDVIISKTTLLHDMNRPDKARDIKATVPFFLGAVDQESVLAERRLRQLQAAIDRIDRDAKAREKSRSRMTERSMALLSQAAAFNLAPLPSSDASEGLLLSQLQSIGSASIAAATTEVRDDLSALESERLALVGELQGMREKRRALKQAIRDASGYDSVVSGQSHKLGLVEHLKLESGKCPVCEAESLAGMAMAQTIRASLAIVSAEVSAISRLRPELANEAAALEETISSRTTRLRELEGQICALFRQSDEATRAATLDQQRAVVIGRVHQFLEMTMQDKDAPATDRQQIADEIASLRDLVDPEAKRDRLRDAENLTGNYATEMLAELPTEMPAKNSRLLFSAEPKITLFEPVRRTRIKQAEIGSDQNYLAIHLSLSFSLQKHFEEIEAPVPGVLVIDQISRPYYAEGGDEKSLEEITKDTDRSAMRQIVRFLFDETERRNGLQVILIEHAYIDDDPKYVDAVRERWTHETNEKLIPPEWPYR